MKVHTTDVLQGITENNSHATALTENLQGVSKTEFIQPKLWVNDVLVGSHFDLLAEVHSYQNEEYTNGGEHYILATPNLGEIGVKSLVWRLQQTGQKCFIHGTNQELSNLVSDKKTAGEFWVGVLEFKQPYDQWLEWVEEQPISPRQATELAKGAIAYLDGVDREVELNTLRQRSKLSTKEWERTVGKLEDEFRREVRSRQGVEVDDSPDEKLRLSLLALLGESDPIVRYRKRAEICSHFRLSKGEVEHLLKILDNRTKQHRVNSYSIEALLAMESEGLQWLIPELLPKGETIILSASPKAGKTLLAIDAAFAIATGEDSFLGSKVERGKVLLISCDESIYSTRNKLIKRGFRSQDNDCVRVITGWTIDQIEALEAQLEDFRPDVVIVDSLRRINHGSKVSENSAEFADNIYTLKETIGRYNASGILIHHSNKDREALGVGKLRGSSAIAGAVWGTWQLEHIPQKDPNNPKKQIIDPKDPRRVLNVFARDTEGQTLKIEFNPENNSWDRLDEESQQEELTLQQRILKVLGLNPSGLSGKQINECLEEQGKGIYTILSRMVNRKLISCRPDNGDKRVNIYKLPKQEIPRDTLPPPVSVQVLTNSNETIDIQGKINSQQNSQHPRESSQQDSQHPQTENQVFTNSNSDIVRDTEIVNTPTTNMGGEGVLTNSTESENLLDAQGNNTEYKVGDIVECYPTYEHQQRDWKVRATITDITYERGYLLSCAVKWTYKKKAKTATIGGGSADWLIRKL